MIPMRSPSTPSRTVGSIGASASGMLVESCGSCPSMTSSSRAASTTVVATGPIWSRLLANATSPYRDTRPYVGFTPTTPHSAAGWRTDPPVSEPSASGA